MSTERRLPTLVAAADAERDRIRADGTELFAMIEQDEAGRMVGIRLNKATGITISVGLIIVLLGGAGAGGAWLYKKGQADGKQEARMVALEALAQDNSAKLQQVLDVTKRIEGGMGDRWTLTHMRRLVREWGQLNPDLKLPDVDEIAEDDD